MARHITVRPSQVTAAKLLVKIAEREGRSVAPEIQLIADAGSGRSDRSAGAVNGVASSTGASSRPRLKSRSTATTTPERAG